MVARSLSVFPPPEPVEIPADLTPEKTLAIFTTLVAGMETALREMLRHAKSEGITDATQAMEEFQHLYLEHVQQLTTSLLKSHGITQEVGSIGSCASLSLSVPWSSLLWCVRRQVFTAALQRAVQENEQFRQQVEQVYANQAKTYVPFGKATVVSSSSFLVRHSPLVRMATCSFRSLGLKVDEP